MSRNGSGVYTKVNTFVSGNPVTAAGHNQNWDDLATEMTNSVAADGQTSMTGPLKASSGTNSLPSHTFASDPDTGGYRSASNEYSIAAGGTQIAAVNSGGVDIKAGTLKLAGSAVFPVPTAQIDDDAVTYAKMQNVSATARVLGRATSGAGDVEELTIGSALEIAGGGVNLSAARRTLPTRQVFTSSSGTYTTPANCLYIKVRMVGGGGGGGGSGNSGSGGAGGTGGNTTFSTFTASGGAPGSGTASSASQGGAGGAASGGTINFAGESGSNVAVNTGGSNVGADGGSSAFFGGAGKGGSSTGGGSGITNTGGGGGGAYLVSSASAGGSGGGGGGSVEGWISSPAATYSYAVGAAGTAGAAGTSGNNGGAGGSGYIIVEEFYN